MSESMVERVARALWDLQYPDGTSWEDWEVQTQRNPGGFDGRDGSRKLARAAIEAMMEPTDEMLEAGSDAGGFDAYKVEQNTPDIWNAMLTAALGKGD